MRGHSSAGKGGTSREMEDAQCVGDASSERRREADRACAWQGLGGTRPRARALALRACPAAKSSIHKTLEGKGIPTALLAPWDLAGVGPAPRRAGLSSLPVLPPISARARAARPPRTFLEIKVLLLQTKPPGSENHWLNPIRYLTYDRETEAQRGGEFPKVPSKSKPLAHCPSPGTHLAPTWPCCQQLPTAPPASA